MSKQQGFTLIEIMITVAIIGILAAIAYPSYTQYKIRVSRADAMSEMTQIAQRIQSYKVVNNNYAGVVLSSGTTPDTGVYGGTTTPKQGTPLYDLKLTDEDGVKLLTDATAKINTWLLVATPKSATAQAGNGVICLNDQGQKFWQKGATSCTLSTTSTWDGR